MKNRMSSHISGRYKNIPFMTVEMFVLGLICSQARDRIQAQLTDLEASPGQSTTLDPQWLTSLIRKISVHLQKDVRGHRAFSSQGTIGHVKTAPCWPLVKINSIFSSIGIGQYMNIFTKKNVSSLSFTCSNKRKSLLKQINFHGNM